MEEKRRYNFVFKDGRPVSVAGEENPQEDGVLLEVPEDFDAVRAFDYLYKDGSLVYSPKKTEEERQAEREGLRAKEESLLHTEAVRNEIAAALIPAMINSLEVDDATALRWKEFYPEWVPGIACGVGFKVRRNDRLWCCIQAHTSQTGWEPENAASLWTGIDEAHAGTPEDPIPYEGNMALVNGLYYAQGGAVYLCTRDTVNPVYHALAELVGLYVEVV